METLKHSELTLHRNIKVHSTGSRGGKPGHLHGTRPIGQLCWSKPQLCYVTGLLCYVWIVLVHRVYFYQNTLGQRPMINFVLETSDLHIQGKRRADLLTVDYEVVSWIQWWEDCRIDLYTCSTSPLWRWWEERCWRLWTLEDCFSSTFRGWLGFGWSTSITGGNTAQTSGDIQCQRARKETWMSDLGGTMWIWVCSQETRRWSKRWTTGLKNLKSQNECWEFETRIITTFQWTTRLMTKGFNTFGLYSAFLAWRAMNFRSRGQPRFTVETMFLHRQTNTHKPRNKQTKCI